MGLALVLFLAIVIRVLFWTTSSTDDMVHLWNVRLRKKHGDICSHEPLDSVLPGKRGYPTLSHALVSLFPQNRWRLAGKGLNIGYDLVVILLAWIVAGMLFLSRTDGHDPRFLAAALVATSPLLLPITSRVKSMGGRTLGNLFAFIYFNALWLGMNGSPSLGIAVGITSALLVVLTSKFAFQAILFITPFLSLFSWNVFPLLVLAASIVATFVVPGLGLRDVLSFELAHSRWYLRNAYTGTTASARNRWTDIKSLPHMFKSNKDLFFGILFRRSSYFVALYSFPLVWLVFIWIRNNGQTSYIQYASLMTLAACCIFLLTSFRPFLFLGQAERYLEYVVPFAAVTNVACFDASLVNGNTLYGLILFQVVMALVNCIYAHYATVKKAVMPTNTGTAHKFVENCSGLNILTIPTKLAFDFSSMREGNRFYYRAINTPENGLLYKEEDYVWFEMPRTDLIFFHQKYNINTIIASKSFLAIAKDKKLDYGLEKYPIIFENEEFWIVSIATNDTKKT